MNTHQTRSPEETKNLASKICEGHNLILLSGELGTGKTTFTKGLGGILGIEEDSIKSPSYTLIREYDGFMHVDFYRLESPDELLLARIKDWDGVVVIEWPEIMIDLIPRPHLHIRISDLGENNREISYESIT